MPDKTEFVGFKIEPSTKQALDKISIDNSTYLRDILNRELDNRELMKDKVKKESPAKLERLKELSSEVEDLEGKVREHRGRLKELRKSLNGLESELNQKRSMKQKIKENLVVSEDNDLDEVIVDQLIGDLE